jgi:hypothetical protein
MNNEFKEKNAKIIMEIGKEEEGYENFEQLEEKAMNVKLINSKLIEHQEKYGVEEFSSKMIAEARAEFKKIKVDMEKLPNPKNNFDFFTAKTKEYLNNVEESNKTTPIYDVMIEMKSVYPAETKTFKDIISEMNKSGANIEVLTENFHGNNEKSGIDTYFVLVMPSSKYDELSTKINVDHDNSSLDVITADKNDYFFLNHLNKDFSLEKSKQLIKSILDNKNSEHDVSDVFRSEMGLGLTKINSTPFRRKVDVSIRTYLENAYKISKGNNIDKDIQQSLTGNISKINGQIKPLNPIEEAIIFTEKQELNSTLKSSNPIKKSSFKNK